MNHEPHILIVDDDRNLAAITKEYLEAKGFQISLVHNADDGLESLKKNNYDICILDVKMPMKDGFSLAEDIRNLKIEVPIIFLTGQKEKEDRIKGLLLGANDYVTKPFSMQELYLRLKNILRWSGQHEEAKLSSFTIGSGTYDPARRTLVIGDSEERLSHMEGQLLMLLWNQPDRRITREQALRQIWQDDENAKNRSLSVYIKKLRSRLEAVENVEILNVYGSGYQLVVKK